VAGEKPRGIRPAGTTAQPRGRFSSAALSFMKKQCDGGLRPAAKAFAAARRVKEEEF
jgi:hypothetical protein